MAKDRHIYGEINCKTGMKNVFQEIRRDVGYPEYLIASLELLYICANSINPPGDVRAKYLTDRFGQPSLHQAAYGP